VPKLARAGFRDVRAERLHIAGMDTSHDDPARLALMNMLARLLKQIADGKALADVPWTDTLPGVRRSAGK
jgi:hypothetical protein